MPRFPATVVAIATLLTPCAGMADDAAAAAEFFEKKIRPVLTEHCLSCHSDAAAKAGKLRGGLRLDTRAGWQKGGDSGPALVPGKAAEGTFLAALRYSGDVQMPPKGKLPPEVVADFERWVKDGALDPRGDLVKPPAAGIDLEKGRHWWAFQPLTSPKAPPVSMPNFHPENAVDAFAAAEWARKGLRPAPPADRRTLVRRAYLDLHGLPPTPDEVEAFVNDSAADAWPRLIDKLLASPHYGERWGRYWLDVARYAEDQAHTFGVKPKRNAFQYRDWVIAAFNADMPFEQFVKRQLAGDLMPAGGEPPFTRLAGLGFLGLGAEYYKNSAREQAIAEELDDRVDTVTRGFLGLTVSCARCHDHKFDPVPTRDYYSLAGIFYGSNLTEAALASPEQVKAYNAAQARVKEAEDAANAFLNGVGRRASASALARTAQYLVVARQVANPKQKVKSGELAKAEGLDRYFLDRWVKFIQSANAGKTPAAFKEWFALKPDAPAEAVAKVAAAVQAKLGEVAIPNLPVEPAKGNKGKKANANDPLTKAMFLDQSAPLFMTPANVEKLFVTAEEKPKMAELRAEVERRKQAAPPAPPMAPVLAGGGQGMKVYIRGNPAAKGEDAPKGFLRVLDASGSKPDFTRLDLAEEIVGSARPLAARVLVNRVWAWHFGRGLVATPSNFGKLGDRPSHPELLDYLTDGFIKNGGSVKWLHHQIMGSAIYRLASETNPQNAGIDPANVYLWRGARRRLDVEAWRDSLLAVSGTLDPAIGGPTYDLKDPSARRRTVYAKVSRHQLDGLLRLFDFPDANVTADRRTVTTVPQQQLFALNSEFVVNQAKAFAARVEKAGATDGERISAAYRLAFGRAPEPAERELGLAFLKRPAVKDDKLTRWQQYAQALLTCNEMMYVD